MHTPGINISRSLDVRIPAVMIWTIIIVCIAPFTLNLLGVDFGLQLTSLQQAPSVDQLFHQLNGAFTHTLLEWTAFSVAVFTVVLAFSHFKITHDLSIAVIGVALLTSGFMDAFHTLAADRLIDAVADNKDLIPFTWAISRVFNASILIIGVGLLILKKDFSRKNSTQFIVYTTLLFVGIAYICIHYSAVSTYLPTTTYPDAIITRPYDVIPLLLYLIAGTFIFPVFFRRYPSLFAHALVISTVPQVAAQLHMAFGSVALFDNHFNIGHFLKIVAYIIPLAGLSLDYIRKQQLLQEEIKERKFMEIALKEAEVRQRAVLETLSDAQITMDVYGIIESINPATETMFGYLAGEIVGKNITNLMPMPYRIEHDFYLSDYLDKNESRVIGNVVEVSGLRKSGEIFPIELSVNEMWFNERRMYSGLLKDITVKKQAAENLAQFKTTLDLTMDCVFMFKPDTFKFYYVNKGAKEQVGYSEEELLQMKPFDIKPDMTEQAFFDMVAPMIAGEKPVHSFETIHQHKNGTRVPVEIFLQYISPVDESPRFVSIVRDIAERKRIEKMKNEFISTVSHELRTPLTSLRGSIGLISGGAVGEVSEKAKSLLTIANNNSERLLLLINDLLDMEKLESGDIPFDFKYTAIVSLLEQALIDNRSYGLEHGVKYRLVRHVSNDTYVIVDRNKFMQVMSNLMSNAAKFSPEGETVDIAVELFNDKIRISVTNKGKAIPKEFHSKLFDKFTQSDSTDSRLINGTGLGMSIVKVIVEKHNAAISFISDEDRGTTFFVDLKNMLAIGSDVDLPESSRFEEKDANQLINVDK